ncbi:hypothetical protein [Streptomyces sp. NPDC058657]|uniref:hypothetical protein n=1 Tax=unclassified Streptomyces TaxID=2593676 RepID=UPI00365BE339
MAPKILRAPLQFILRAPPPVSDTARPVPRWAMRLAYALPLVLLPSCLWRLPFAFHFEMGQLQEASMPSYWVGVPYVFGLSVLTEVVAWLTVGLVRGWGEVAPAWMPFIGGRRVRPLAAVVPGVAGGLVLTVALTGIPLGGGRSLMLYGMAEGVAYAHDGWYWLAAVAVGIPTTFWGPAVIALAVAYYRRRTGGGAGPSNGEVSGGAVPATR